MSLKEVAEPGLRAIKARGVLFCIETTGVSGSFPALCRAIVF